MLKKFYFSKMNHFCAIITKASSGPSAKFKPMLLMKVFQVAITSLIPARGDDFVKLIFCKNTVINFTKEICKRNFSRFTRTSVYENALFCNSEVS